METQSRTWRAENWKPQERFAGRRDTGRGQEERRRPAGFAQLEEDDGDDENDVRGGER